MKIAIISDIHVSNKRLKEIKGLPITFFLLHKQIKHIVENDNPDIIIFNGDLIQNPNKMDLLEANFLVFIFNEIYTWNPDIKIIVNTGNHDILYSNTEIVFGNFTYLFNNTKNVYPVCSPRVFKLTNSLVLHMIPYVSNEKIVEYMNNAYFNSGYNLFVLHTNIDLIHQKLFNKFPDTKSYIEIEKFRSQIDTGYYHILNGHYHNHRKYQDDLTVIGSLIQQSYQEKIFSIKDYGKYHGYQLIDFKTRDDIDIQFIPYKYGICSIHYKGIDKFEDEFDLLKQNILQNENMVFYQIKIEDINARKEIIQDKVKLLNSLNNVIECKYIGTLDVDIKNIKIGKTEINSSNIGGFDLKSFYIDTIKKIYSESDKSKMLIKQFESIVSDNNGG